LEEGRRSSHLRNGTIINTPQFLAPTISSFGGGGQHYSLYSKVISLTQKKKIPTPHFITKPRANMVIPSNDLISQQNIPIQAKGKLKNPEE